MGKAKRFIALALTVTMILGLMVPLSAVPAIAEQTEPTAWKPGDNALKLTSDGINSTVAFHLLPLEADKVYNVRVLAKNAEAGALTGPQRPMAGDDHETGKNKLSFQYDSDSESAEGYIGDRYNIYITGTDWAWYEMTIATPKDMTKTWAGAPILVAAVRHSDCWVAEIIVTDMSDGVSVFNGNNPVAADSRGGWTTWVGNLSAANDYGGEPDIAWVVGDPALKFIVTEEWAGGMIKLPLAANRTYEVRVLAKNAKPGAPEGLRRPMADDPPSLWQTDMNKLSFQYDSASENAEGYMGDRCNIYLTETDWTWYSVTFTTPADMANTWAGSPILVAAMRYSTCWIAEIIVTDTTRDKNIFNGGNPIAADSFAQWDFWGRESSIDNDYLGVIAGTVWEYGDPALKCQIDEGEGAWDWAGGWTAVPLQAGKTYKVLVLSLNAREGAQAGVQRPMAGDPPALWQTNMNKMSFQYGSASEDAAGYYSVDRYNMYLTNDKWAWNEMTFTTPADMTGTWAGPPILVIAMRYSTVWIAEIIVTDMETGENIFCNGITVAADTLSYWDTWGSNVNVNNDYADFVEVEPLIINPEVTYQTIEGFGYAYGLDAPDGSGLTQGQWLDRVVNDLGLTMWRSGVSPAIPPDSASDWQDGRQNVLMMKETADAAGEPFRVILTAWSPPGEWKVALPSWNTDNGTRAQLNAERNARVPHLVPENGGTLNPDHYADYAKWWIDVINMYKDIGVDVYAISLQNEPAFQQSYGSCVYTDDWYLEMIVNVVPAIKAAHPNILVFGSECMLMHQNDGVYWGWNSQFHKVLADTWPQAEGLLDRFAVHGYADGVSALGIERHKYHWGQHKANYGFIPIWMTETSGYLDMWNDGSGNGALNLAMAIQTGLVYGNMAAWVWWQGGGHGTNSEAMGTGIKYEASKQFYRYIRPGAVRIDAQAPNANNNQLEVSAFLNTNGTITVVFVNASYRDHKFDASSLGIDTFDHYITSGKPGIRNFETLGVDAALIDVPARSVVTIVSGAYKADGPGFASPGDKDASDVEMSRNILERASDENRFVIASDFASTPAMAFAEASKFVNGRIIKGVSAELTQISFVPAINEEASKANGEYTFFVHLSKGEADADTKALTMTINFVKLENAKLTINGSVTHQTMEGFGIDGISGGNGWADLVVNDLGMSIFQDRIDPNPLLSHATRLDALKELAETYYAKHGEPMNIALSVMSPPIDMKVDAGDHWWGGGTDRKTPWPHYSLGTLDPTKYAEFSSWLVGIFDVYTELGFNVYAISLQYEPLFPHDWESKSNYTPAWYAQMVREVAPRLRVEYPDIRVFGPSSTLMFELAFDWNYSGQYLRHMFENARNTLPHIDIFSTNDTGGNADEWRRWNQQFTENPNALGQVNWVTGSELGEDNWGNAVNLAMKLQNDLYYGNVAAWITRRGGSVNDSGGNLYGVLKGFYKYIQSGAVRLGTLTQPADINTSLYPSAVLSTAFLNPDGTYTITIVNTTGTAYGFDIAAEGLPGEYAYFVSTVADGDNCRFDGFVDIANEVSVPAYSVVTLVSDYEEPMAAYTIKLFGETSGGSGYQRSISVTGENLEGKFIVARVLNGTGVNASIMVMVINARESATVSYSKKDAVVDVWLTDGMPNLTGGSLGVIVYSTAN